MLRINLYNVAISETQINADFHGFFLIYYFLIYEVRFNAQTVDSKLSNRK